MNLLKINWIAIALLLFAAPAAPAQTYDVVKDFSFAANPNGVWSYGYITALQTPFILYTDKDDQCLPGVSFWGLYVGPCNLMPVVAHNDTGKMFCWLTNCLPSNYLMVQPGFNGELSVVRWTAPSSGTYKVQGRVVGIDCSYPTSTDLRVVRNTDKQILKITIDTCKSPVLVQSQMTFSAGDTLDVEVDWGKDGNPYGDGTAIQLRITTID